MDVEYEESCLFDRLELVNGWHPTWLGAGPDGKSGRALGYDDDYYNFFGENDDLIDNSILCGSLGNDTETASFKNGAPTIIRQSTSNEMTIIFTSDLDEQRNGFELTWRGVGDDLRQDSGQICFSDQQVSKVTTYKG